MSGVPGGVQNNLPRGTDWIAKELADLRRQLRRLKGQVGEIRSATYPAGYLQAGVFTYFAPLEVSRTVIGGVLGPVTYGQVASYFMRGALDAGTHVVQQLYLNRFEFDTVTTWSIVISVWNDALTEMQTWGSLPVSNDLGSFGFSTAGPSAGTDLAIDTDTGAVSTTAGGTYNLSIGVYAVT